MVNNIEVDFGKGLYGYWILSKYLGYNVNSLYLKHNFKIKSHLTHGNCKIDINIF